MSKVQTSADLEFARPVLGLIQARLTEPRRFIQVLGGPRQVGKTTLARQAMAASGLPSHYATADSPTPHDASWIAQQWEVARRRAASGTALLVLDEVQKVAGWAEVVKAQWDADTAQHRYIRVLVLGSAPLLVQHGLAENLAGRFERIACTHWSFTEMREAFGWSLDEYVYFGGYPGAASLVADEPRWRRFIEDSLIETTISRDILLLTRVDKPALLRRLFHLTCEYSGQVLSYTKMLGQLHDAGNTTTLAHYLDLLGASGFVTGVAKYCGGRVRQRASSPKLCVLNSALLAVTSGASLAQTRADGEVWGRFVESAVGAHLLNEARRIGAEVSHWRDGILEVDFVVASGRHVVAIEVKSGRKRAARPGMAAFLARFGPARALLVGEGGIPVGEFLATPVEAWLGG